MNTKAFRHGEILFVKISKIPTGLKQKETDTFLVGSGQNPHTFSGGKFYEKVDGDFIFGYFKAKDDVVLEHKEHGNVIGKNGLRKAILPAGKYELRKQQEYINDELKPVID